MLSTCNVPDDEDSKASIREHVIACEVVAGQGQSPLALSLAHCATFSHAVIILETTTPCSKSCFSGIFRGKCQAGWTFEVSQDGIYVLYCVFLFLLLNSQTVLVKAKCCSENIL